jgi:hypothetical protein
MRVFLKQYGERRTGTNYLRTLIQSNYSDVVPLMHVLGDKHSPPVPFDRLWSEARSQPDPAFAFALSATLHAPAESTEPGDSRQRDEVRRVAAPLAEAYANGSLGFIISIKDPYAWAVSVAMFLCWIGRKAQLGPAFAPQLAAACRELNLRYAEWLRLARQHPARCHVVRYEDLLADPDGVLGELDVKFGLQRSTTTLVNVTGEAFAVGWDQHRSKDGPAVFDRGYYVEKRYLARLSPQALDVVTRTIDWDLLAPLGYTPSGVSEAADQGAFLSWPEL